MVCVGVFFSCKRPRSIKGYVLSLGHNWHSLWLAHALLHHLSVLQEGNAASSQPSHRAKPKRWVGNATMGNSGSPPSNCEQKLEPNS
ncbi:hypothetical protein ACE6H2_010094 [Prunus campanulata]